MKKCLAKREANTWMDRKFIKISRTAEKLIGWPGRMLYHSKSMRQPTTICNGNIFNSRAKKIWFGDIEIERDREGLLKLSKRLGPVYVLEEMDGRFLELVPTLAYVKRKALVIVEDGKIWYSETFAESITILVQKLSKDRNSVKKVRRQS